MLCRQVRGGIVIYVKGRKPEENGKRKEKTKMNTEKNLPTYWKYEKGHHKEHINGKTITVITLMHKGKELATYNYVNGILDTKKYRKAIVEAYMALAL